MKKRNLFVIGGTMLFCGFIHSSLNAQNVWPNNGSITVESTTLSNVGIGLTNPASMLHLHGTQNFTIPGVAILDGGQGVGTAPMSFGPTSRIQFTNTNIPINTHRGFELRQSGFDMYFNNLETRGNIHIAAVGTPRMTFHSDAKRIFVGGIFGPGSQLQTSDYASFNVGNSADNGLYVRATKFENYGIRIESMNKQNAFEIINRDVADVNLKKCFNITGEGFVFARRYTTTLQNIPDYVFAPDYSLMSFQELRDYLRTNRHLPNIPSAVEMEAEPVDLGELTRLLLEKVEESTLYILQLEERIRVLESGN
jgi:hypothetical protein